MPDTTLGITYPASTDHTRLWEHMQTMADDVDGLIDTDRDARDAAWTSYTPSIVGSSGGTWTAGNATIACAYHRLGRRVRIQGRITFGSTTVVSGLTGSFRVSLPSGVPAVGIARPLFGVGDIVDTSVPARWTYVIQLDQTTSFAMMRYDGTFAAAASPMTWANGDILDFYGEYESASAP